MAKINNQAVMQKLIDELNLYPAKDVIPTELAEKILAVYQVNAQDVNVEIKKNPVVNQDLTLNSNDKSFTVPDGKIWIVNYGFIKYVSDANGGSRLLSLEITDGTSRIWWIEPSDDTIAASETNYVNISAVGSLTTEKGTNNKYKHYPIPHQMILTEGSVVRFYDSINRSALDDFEFTLVVDELDAE